MAMRCEMVAAATPSAVTFQNFGHVWIAVQISLFFIVVSRDEWKSGPKRAAFLRRPRGFLDAIIEAEIVRVMLRQKV